MQRRKQKGKKNTYTTVDLPTGMWMVAVRACTCVWICCVRGDAGECKEIKEERKMNLLVSGDGGRIGVWI